MTDKKTTDGESISVSLARQPVFDAQLRLWGYELVCVGGGGRPGFALPENENVALNVASGAYIGLQQILDRGRKVLVGFNEKSILDDLPYALPPVLAVVKVREKLGLQPSVSPILERLKSDGYLIAVTEFSADPAGDSLYRLADIFSLEVVGKGQAEMAALLDQTRLYGAQTLAQRVEDRPVLEFCQGVGFSLFHGPFFKAPEKITVRKLSSSEISRFNLLGIIEKDEPDLGRLAETIQADVAISFRLLSYLNSAAFGFPQKIKSIHQAISLLGWRKMKNWLRVVLLTDMSQRHDAPELVFLSAQRGRFLELIGREQNFWGFDPDSLHLLGIFSLLEAMLGLPMTEVVTYLPLENKLKAALCQEPNNEYLPLLELARHLEEANWTESEKTIQRLNLDPAKVRAAFQASVDWAGESATLHSS